MKLPKLPARKSAPKAKNKKPVTKKTTTEAPVKKSVEQKVVHDYQLGKNYAELAEKYEITIEAVAEIVGA